MAEKLAEEKINKILEFYKQGFNYTQISKIMQISRNTVSKYVRQVGLASIKLNHGKTTFNNLFNKIDTEETAYWLGFLYADGYLESSAYRIGLGSIDEEHIQKFKTFVGSENKILHEASKNSNHSDYFRFKFSSKIVYNNLINLGVFPQKSLIVKCPDEKQVSNHLFLHFVRGYVDGDGSVLLIRNQPRLYLNGTKDMLNGIIIRMNWQEKELMKNKNIYMLHYEGKKIASIYIKQLYKEANVYLNRKYNKYLEIIASLN